MSENIGNGKHKVGLHPLQRAQLPRRDDLLDPQSQWVVAVVEGLHHHPVRRRGQFGDLASFGGVSGERLFAQHVLAGLDGRSSPFAVQAVWQWVVDRIDVRIGDQLGVVVVHPGDVVFGGEGLGARHIACGYRRHDHVRVVFGRVD